VLPAPTGDQGFGATQTHDISRSSKPKAEEVGLLSQQDSTAYSAVLGDGLGSVRALANMQGQIVGSFAYGAFGSTQRHARRYGHQLLQLCRRTDGLGTGLVNLRARSYDPRVARFLSRDTLVQGGPGTQGVSRYAYVSNGLARCMDPSGHRSDPFRGALGLAAAGAIAYADNNPEQVRGAIEFGGKVTAVLATGAVVARPRGIPKTCGLRPE